MPPIATVLLILAIACFGIKAWQSKSLTDLGLALFAAAHLFGLR